MHPPPSEEVLAAMTRLPSAPCLLTTAFGDIRDGRIVDRVQQCGTNPPMLLVAMEKGHTLSPLIRDSRTFALSVLDPNERHIQRVFGPDRRIGDDPFLTYPHQVGVLGAPIVTRCTAWFDCEVVRHLDMETNFELYIGLVHAAGIGTGTAPRLSAALSKARGGDARTLRPRATVDRAAVERLAVDRLPAAESPAERARPSGDRDRTLGEPAIAAKATRPQKR
jgi:flavin reductase (DIM6/NTAB) family NADH-FMN oxidoreductase RutF